MSDQVDRLKAALADRYAIERELGSGGMATVYLAEDLKHHRKVAVKVLRPELAATLGPERFLREIEVAARLTHPHILPLHDSGEADGFLFYVMPYIEGESLRERLNRDRELPVGDAVRILRDVVDALTEAHSNGLVHRDIKPENVLLRGRHALVADFGVAKAVSEATGRQKLTTAGVALGTPAYMAPEQASADPNLDHRVDIYAVGVMAYEMLSGQTPFQGSTAQQVLAAHMTEAPTPVTQHRDAVPPDLANLVMRCLEKRPADRWQTTEELLHPLEALATPSGGVTPTQTQPLSAISKAKRPVAAVAISAAAVVAVILLVVLMGLPTANDAPVQLPVPRQVTANPIETAISGAAVSPDGTYLAFVDPRGVHLQVLGTGETHTVEIDEPIAPRDVSWFPDGTRLLVVAAGEEGDRNLWSVSMLGGRPTKVTNNVHWATVSPDGQRIAFISGAGAMDRSFREVWLIGPNGEDPRLLLTAEPQEGFFQLAWSPDSRRLAFGNWRRPRDIIVETITVDGEERSILLQDDRLFQSWTGVLPFTWCADGRFVFSFRDGPTHQATSNVWVAPTDVGRGTMIGEPRRVTQLAGSNVRRLSVAEDCSTMIAMLVRNQADVWVGELNSAGDQFIDETQLTFDERMDRPTGWTPDGRSVVFHTSRGGNYDLYQRPLDADGPLPILVAPGDQTDGIASADGQWLLYRSGQEIRRLPWSGGAPEVVLGVLGVRGRFRCPRSETSRCVVGHVVGDTLVFASFDPAVGEPRELTRISYRAPFTTWDISPDGSTAAVVHNDDNVVRLVELASGRETAIEVDDWRSFEMVAWAADGSGLFLDANSSEGGFSHALLHIDMDGQAHVLRERPNEWHVYPVASPDGRYLAFASMPFHGNAWLIEGF